MTRQFKVWCPEFNETEDDASSYDNPFVEDAVEQYMHDNTGPEEEEAACDGRSFEIFCRREGFTHGGRSYPLLKYKVTGEISFDWYPEISDESEIEEADTGIPDEELPAPGLRVVNG